MMRRKDRLKDRSFCNELMDTCTHGVVAVATDEGAPYCLPLSLVRVNDDLYFHGAKVGRKLDLMRKHPQVCVTFVGRDEPAFVPPTEYTTYFRSVIATGTASEVTDFDEKVMALRALCEKTTPDAMGGDYFKNAIAHSESVTAVWKIHLDTVSGKEKSEKG